MMLDMFGLDLLKNPGDFSEHDDDSDESGRRGKDKQINIIIGTWSYEHVVSDRKKRGRGID